MNSDIHFKNKKKSAKGTKGERKVQKRRCKLRNRYRLGYPDNKGKKMKNEKMREKEREEERKNSGKVRGNGRYAKFSTTTATRARKVENNCGIAVADATGQSRQDEGDRRYGKNKEAKREESEMENTANL